MTDTSLTPKESHSNPLPGKIGLPLPWLLTALAAVGLLALGAIDNRAQQAGADRSNTPQHAESVQDSDAAAKRPYDGRGKWTGY